MATTVRADQLQTPAHNPGASDETIWSPIDTLESIGMQRGDIKKFQEAGYHTADSILMTSARHLERIKGLSEAKVLKAQESAGKVCRRLGFQSARAVREKRQSDVFHITTGSTELDNLLQGGIETGVVTEIVGEFRTGKTQLAMTLAVTSLMAQEQGGGNGAVLYLDSENAFSDERLAEIADRFSVDRDLADENVFVHDIYNEDNFEPAFKEAKRMIAERQVSLVIVDSVMSVLRNEYQGRGELSARQQKLSQILYTMKRMAQEFNIAVVLTNQMCADPGSTFTNDAKKAVGGHVLAHLVNIRLYLRKGRGEQRIARIEKSCKHALGEATFELSAGGIMDVAQ